MQWTNSQSQNQTAQPEERTIRMNSGVFRLDDRQEQTLHIVYGVASVKLGEQDILLTRGEEMHISSENENVFVEALQQQPLLFQIYLN